MSLSRIKYSNPLFRSCILSFIELSPIERQCNPSSTNLLQCCRAQIAEKFCSASLCYNHWSWSWAWEEWKCYSQTISLIASCLSFVNGSYQQNRWWLQVPSDNSSFSMPKAFVEFASFPSSHFDCCNLTCFTGCCHIWRSRQIKDNQQISRKSQVVMVKFKSAKLSKIVHEIMGS